MCVYVSHYLCRSPRFGSSRSGPPPGKKFGNPGDRLRKKRWDLDELPKFEKNFYTEHIEVQRMSQVRVQCVILWCPDAATWCKPVMVLNRSVFFLPVLWQRCLSLVCEAWWVLLSCDFSMNLKSIVGRKKSQSEARAARSPSPASIRHSFPVSTHKHAKLCIG